MSILDEIKAAEAAAAQAKKEAALTSRNLLRDAEEAANREADAMITAARAAASASGSGLPAPLPRIPLPKRKPTPGSRRRNW